MFYLSSLKCYTKTSSTYLVLDANGKDKRIWVPKTEVYKDAGRTDWGLLTIAPPGEFSDCQHIRQGTW